MKMVTEISIKDFEFWGGAKTIADKLTDDEFGLIEDALEDVDPPMTPTAINDLFWFDTDWIADILDTTTDEILARE